MLTDPYELFLILPLDSLAGVLDMGIILLSPVPSAAGCYCFFPGCFIDNGLCEI